ncbi:hypothetical protein [Actinoplanes sp. NPDC051859]|uniref:hypothetical protein n=1 Tax=Actinoplanes sp. NPDC051859 TaxID=3363909 RepID=UPI00379F2763
MNGQQAIKAGTRVQTRKWTPEVHTGTVTRVDGDDDLRERAAEGDPDSTRYVYVHWDGTEFTETQMDPAEVETIDGHGDPSTPYAVVNYAGDKISTFRNYAGRMVTTRAADAPATGSRCYGSPSAGMEADCGQPGPHGEHEFVAAPPATSRTCFGSPSPVFEADCGQPGPHGEHEFVVAPR